MAKKLCTLILAAWALVRTDGAFVPITREDAAEGREVCVTGVVTAVAYWQKNSCIVASVDDPDGMAVYVAGEHPDSNHVVIEDGPVEVGDVLEIKGRTIPMLFSPGIYARSFARISRKKLPPAPLRSLSDFGFGVLDNRRTRMAGVVSHVTESQTNQVEMTLATAQGNVDTRVRAPFEAARRLLDAEVLVEGVAMSRYNLRAEFLGIRLEVNSIDDVKVTKNPPPDPFSARRTPLNAILSWRPEGHDGHRCVVRGTVTATGVDGVFYMQSGECAVRAKAFEGRAPRAGTAIEASGFPEMIGDVGQLVDVLWRELPVEPERIDPIEIGLSNITNVSFNSDIVFNNLDCRLVSLCGRLFRIERMSGGFDMIMDVDGASVGVIVHGEMPRWIADELEYLPLVSVSGIMRIATADGANGRRPGVSAVSIEVQDQSAVRFVPDGEWRERRNARMLVVALYVFGGLLSVAGIWLVWRVRQRAARERFLLAERRRMADDLHDTIEQHLAGARILLSTAVDNMPADGEASAKALSMAQEVLGEAKRQIRDVIMNLRQEETIAKPLEELLAAVVSELNARGIAKSRMRLRGVPKDLSASAKADVLAIVRQAVANAMKHGGAKNIVIVSDPAGEGFVLKILNDGAEFDASSAPGPEAGHFGLSNMRERARRSGFSIAWSREGAWNCVVLARGVKR
ncbi:MAG: hypothetical protein E7049_00210 [Lentisphaerae bacterium]|nr:hypothetical protein [Lentisphaerota bacterium]